VKNPRSASCTTGIFLRIEPRANCASTAGSRCPAISASSIARPDTPKMSLITELSLTCASSSSFSARCISRVRSWVNARRYAEVRVMPRSERVCWPGAVIGRGSSA
jgi:hypothetical protein